MRLVRVRAPEGMGQQVARIAFDAGVPQVAIHQQQSHRPDQPAETKDIVDLETATPTAKKFIDELMSADFFKAGDFSIAVRQPRSVVTRERPPQVTWPLVEPTTDIFEELWQFSHVTFGFVGRIVIAGSLLAYGMIQAQLLIMIAGLLFLPLLPLLLATGFGTWTRQWRLVGQGLFAFLVALALLFAAGAAVAALSEPPLKYNEHNPFLVGVLISVGVGIAAGLATADDVGRREMIGLAATAQLAILPVWFGITLVFGVSPLESASPSQRALAFGVNVVTIVVVALITYALLGMRGSALSNFTKRGED